MGINFSDVTQCSKPCKNCDNIGNLFLKDCNKINLDLDKKKEKSNKRYSTTISKDINNSIQDKFFSNKIINYINDSNAGNDINNISNLNSNNINTFRSGNIQSNNTEKKTFENDANNMKINNFNINYNENMNENNNIDNQENNNKNSNNDNNNENLDIFNNTHMIFNNNNVTIEKQDNKKEDNSIYEDNKDSFVKMEENIVEEDKKFEKGLNQYSKIEEKNEKSLVSNKEKNQINMNLDNANIEDLMNIIEIKNIENDSTIIEYNGEKGIFKGKLENKKNICGKGKIQYKDGRTYEGIFEKGVLNGKGKYTSSKGDIYEGTFTNGNLSGLGTIIMIKENKNASLSFNKEDSSEIFQDEINKEKIIYKGYIKDFKKEGIGVEECDEYKYEGYFHEDKKNGQGVVIYKTGDKYKGEFKDDKLTGNGNYLWNNGDTYNGEFLDGKMNGRGIYKWKEGGEYEGEYRNNIREGKGIFRWKNGIIFEGNFVDGKPEGQGIMKVKNKKVNVKYKNGELMDNLKEILDSIN